MHSVELWSGLHALVCFMHNWYFDCTPSAEQKSVFIYMYYKSNYIRDVRALRNAMLNGKFLCMDGRVKPRGLRRQVQVLVSSEARVRILHNGILASCIFFAELWIILKWSKFE